ncbi:hypothetical protein GGI20_001108 [Coemansia sp. BCRC 34301]|nr:hypothetical protein GGI20_001108 [Coemansia sp. BCRC 34301]
MTNGVRSSSRALAAQGTTTIMKQSQRGLANLAMFAAAKRLAQPQEPFASPAKIAIVDEAGVHSYADLLGDARKVRAALGNKDHLGASIAMLMPSSYEYAAIQWGIWASGGAAVPLSPMHPERELEYFISNSDSRYLICHPALLPNVQPALSRLDRPIQVLMSDSIMEMAQVESADDMVIDENQGALFIYTSGTTGKPKGVVHTHASIAAQVCALHKAWGWTVNDRLLHMLPLHHIHGIVVALCSALYSGATTEMLPKFDRDRVWSRIIDGPQDISIIMGVPTMYSRLLQALDAMPPERQLSASSAMGRLRLTVSGSAALPASVFRQWQQATGQVMLERYGMSEIGMALSNDAANPAERRAGSVGKPLPSVKVRLADTSNADVTNVPEAMGMIQVRGPSVFREYYGLPDKTAKEFTSDGWFITGDIGTRDADGRYYIMGRESVDIIKSGGYKLSALEIERELLDHPNIADVAVIGIPSAEWGEEAAAAVVLRKGTALTISDLKPWCYARMANYKTPRQLCAVEALPRNLMGKLDKKAVKALFE